MKTQKVLLAVALTFGATTIATTMANTSLEAQAKKITKKEIAVYKTGTLPGSKFKIGDSVSKLKKKYKNIELKSDLFYLPNRKFSYRWDATKKNPKITGISMGFSPFQYASPYTQSDYKKAFGNPIKQGTQINDEYGIEGKDAVFKSGKYYVLYQKSYNSDYGSMNVTTIGTKQSIIHYAPSYLNFK